MKAVLIIMGAFVLAWMVVLAGIFAQCKIGEAEGICYYGQAGEDDDV